ncbi:hypothetical protein ABG419_004520, partial [Salmonella enterica subsp. enterica]|nr:hypothetical protein [Salmonella enterica subsp. enterica serovar Havana]EGY1704166.1 hypothetical protein [Salmonella enterica]
MSKTAKYFFMLLIFPTICFADCAREVTSCYLTKLGLLEQRSKEEARDGYSHLILNGVEIYKTKTPFMAFISDDEGVFKNKKYITTKTIF